MAMRLAVTSAEELGTISGSTLTLSGNVDGAATFAGAILRSAQVIDSGESSADGYETTVKIEYADQSVNGYDFELWHVTYNTSGDTLTLDTRIDSNDGGSAVTWSGTVRVYGIVSDNHYVPEKVITLQEPVETEFTNTISDSTSTSFTPAADVLKVTPLSDQSDLVVTVDMSGFIARTSSGGTLAGQVQINYVNESNVNTSIGLTKNLGFRNVTADDNMVDSWDRYFQFTLTQSNLNDETPAKWEIKPMMKVDGSGRTVTCSNGSFRVKEILRLS